jgi:hypothetical protein
MRLYKIQSKNECGLYKNFYEYPRLDEIVKNPVQYTVTEYYTGRSGQVLSRRSISTADYATLVKNIGLRRVIIVSIADCPFQLYRAGRACEAVADYLTRPSLVNGKRISIPRLTTQDGTEFKIDCERPVITTETKQFKHLSLEDVKKLEIYKGCESVDCLIRTLDWMSPEWRQPRFNNCKLEDWTAADPNLKPRVTYEDEKLLSVPQYIQFCSNGIKIDIGKDLLVQ